MSDNSKSYSAEIHDTKSPDKILANLNVAKTLIHNKIKTALILSSFALMFAGKVLIEPSEEQGERWFD